jgi:hypothetical protein
MADEEFRALVVSMRLDPYSWGGPRFLGVVDANAILSSVGNDCRKGPYWRSGLLRMTDGGTAALQRTTMSMARFTSTCRGSPG